MENDINSAFRARVDAYLATKGKDNKISANSTDDTTEASIKGEKPTSTTSSLNPPLKARIDAYLAAKKKIADTGPYRIVGEVVDMDSLVTKPGQPSPATNKQNDTEGTQIPVVDTVGQKLQQKPASATNAMPQESTVPVPTAEEAQSGASEETATQYRIPTFRTPLSEQPKTDSLMTDIDARVDAVADELEQRYAEDERNRIKGRPLSERVFDAYETNDSPIAKSIGDMSAARQATGADRIIKDVMTFNDEQKAQLNTAIAEQVASDRDYQDAKSELEDVIKSVGADKPQVSDKDAAEIMKSLTPEQRKAAEAEIERVQAEIARATNVFNIVSQDVAKRVSNKVNNDIVSRIIDRLATRNMPKSDMEYIGKAIYNNSIAGMLYETAVKAASGSSWVDYAVSAKGLERYDASTAAKVAGGVGALLADSGIFSILSMGGGAAAGAITNLATRIVAGRIAQGATTTLAKGALQQTAKRIATSQAITRLASNVIAQSATLGSYDAASSILQQNLANPEGIDWVEVLKRAGTGAASGAAVGGIGVATQAVKGLPRMDALKAKGLPMDIAIGSLGLLAENAAFVGIGSLASGEDADLQSFAEGLATLGILKGVGMLKSGMRNPSNRVRTFAERTLSDLRFTPEEEAAFRKAGIAENGLSIIRSAVEHAGETTTTEESAGAVRDTYNEVMASKDIPLSAKVKLQYIVTGQVQNVPDVVKMDIAEPAEEGAAFTVNSYDSRGRLLSVSEFADRKAARAYINKYSSLVERNSIAQYEQMVNGVSNLVAIDRAARRYAAENNADAQEIFNDILIANGIVKGDLPSDERLVRAAEVENMARNSGRDFLRDIVRRVAVRNEASSQEVMQAMNVKPYLRTEKEKRLVADYVKEIKGFVGRPVDIRPPKPNTTGRIEAGAQTPAEPAPDVAPQNPQTPPRPSVDDAMRAQIEDSVRSLSKLNSDEIVSVNIGSSPFGSGTAVVREGYVILDENGDIDHTLSDSTVVVEFEDGRRATVSIDDIDEVTYQGDVTDMVNRAVERQEQAMQMLGEIDASLGKGQSVAVRLMDGTEGVVSGIDEYENYIFTTNDEQGNAIAMPLTGVEVAEIRPIATSVEKPQSEQPTEESVADATQGQGAAPSVEDAEQPQTVEPEYDEDFPPLTDADFAPVIDYDTVKWAELSPKDWTDTMRLYASQNSENPDAMVVRSARSYYNNSKSKVANADKRIAAKDKEIERLRAGLDRAANPQETIKQSKRIQKAQEERNAFVRSKDAIVKEMAQYEYALREYGIDVKDEESLLREQAALQQERAELVEADADLERTNDELALQEMKTIVNTEQNRKKVYDLYVARGVTPEQAGLRQAILWDIATGNVRLRWEDGQTPSGAKTKGLASELGLGGSASDKRAYKSVVSRDGMSVDEYVHSLWEQRGGYTNDLDDMEMKNEVLDVLQGAPNGSRALEQLYEMLGIAADREEGFGQSKADIERRIKDVDARIAENQQAIMEFNKRVNDVIGGLGNRDASTVVPDRDETWFKKKETSEPTNSITDVDSNLTGKSDDTATRQDSNVSIDKSSNNSVDKQENAENNQRLNDITANESVVLSDEIDENGRQFVLAPNGELAFGKIEEVTGLPAAPILLSEGVITNPATNDGYGLVHIEARHGKQIREAGYKSVLDFIDTVAKNYDVIKQGLVRDGHQTYRLQLTDEHNNTLMVELSSDGSYWNINTAGIFKNSYGKNNKEVYNRHTTVKQPAESVETSRDQEQSGTLESPSMNVSLTSESKDSNNSAEKQENAEKVEAKPQPSARANMAPSKPTAPSNKIEDYGEVIKGARKDAMKELAKSVDNATLESLISLPFAKAFKRPDLRKAVDEGALREQDARFAEAVMATYLSTKKPKADTKKDKYRKAVWGKSKVEVWADEAYKGVQLLKQLFEAEPAERDRIMAGAMAEHYTGVEAAKAHQERLKEWNPGKTFTGESYPINNVALFNEVLGRLGNDVGTTDIPVVGAMPNTSYDSYLLVRPNGDTLFPTHTLRTFEDVVEEVVYLTKLNNADADTEHPGSAFKARGLEPQKEVVGYYVHYMLTPSSRPKDQEFKTKEAADAFYAKINSKNGALALQPHEIYTISGYGKYEIAFKNPITEEWVETGIIRDSQADAIASIDQERDALNKAVNDKLAQANEKTGKTKATEYIQVRSYFDSGKVKYGVVIADKYGPKKTAFGTMPYYFAEGFATRKEAETALEKNRTEWEGFVKDIIRKRQEYVYFDGKNAPRAGKDYRGGKDVTEKDFAETFGFRGVQFGNWTNQNDRQAAVNNAYDSFMDLANIIGVSPRALSLNGELGIAFGSRGSGKANAHYESDNVVINLTKTRGAGSLAHEWWHALDNYFARQAKVPAGFVTSDKKLAMREQLRQAFDDLIDDVAKSDYNERSSERGTYWGSPIEETARLFEEWVVDEQTKRGERNHFLAEGIGNAEADYAEMNYLYYKTATEMSNESRKRQGQEPEKVMSFEEFKKTPMALAGFVYPSAEELRTLGEDVRAIFDTVQERVDEETGNVALFHRGDNSTTPPASVDADRWNAIVDMVKEGVGAENVITDPEDVKAEYDRIMAGQQRVRERIVEDANSRFNEQLDRFADGTIKTNEMFNLGTPGAVLLSTGIKPLPIELTQHTLRTHLDKHKLTIEDIKDLPRALENPIMVYEWGDKAKATVVITDVERDEERITVAIRLKPTSKGLIINSATSIHGKSVERLIADMNNGKSDFAKDNLKLVDKRRVLDWLASDSFGRGISNQELNSATKVVKEFENPKVEAENLHNTDLRERIVEDANSRFNEQLDRFADGTMPSGDKIQLGTPGATLLASGVQNSDMSITQRVLKEHLDKHDLSIEDIKDLPQALENPIMVYEWGKLAKSTIVITEIPRGDERIAVAIRFREAGNGIKINHIASVHGKSASRLLDEMTNGKSAFAADNLRYVDKEKVSHWLATGNSFGSSVSNEKLDSATKVVKEFENPKVEAENLHNTDLRERIVEDANSRFNEQLEQQIAGTLPQGHIYQLGTPSPILLSCGIPNLPIELAASRLSDKSMQENHPFGLPEIEGLVDAIQNPLAVFRSATRIGSNVILTELKHGDKSFVVAIRTNQRRGRITVNSIRSIHYRNTDMNIVNWINEGLADYIKPTFAQEWLEPTIKKLRSKPQYNSADVRAQLKDVAKVVKEFENPKVEAENLRQCIVYHGSGADFEKFDHSHMGEGEGAQAYGWGTYVTEVNGIAKSYAEATAKGKATYKGYSLKEMNSSKPLGVFASDHERGVIGNIVARVERGLTAQAAIAEAIDDMQSILSRYAFPDEKEDALKDLDVIKQLRPEDFGYIGQGRNLYTVDIPDDNGQNYLKWNARIKGEQAKRILDWIENSPYKKAFDHEKHIYEQVGERFHPIEGRTGKDVYEFLQQIMHAPYAPEAEGSADKRASQALSEMGFVGISYPAQYRSGGRSDGARNYVIFNENDAQIVDHERYFRTPNGEVYGFTIGGRIYLDSSKMNAETPIHEYTELWSKVVAENNPELWRRGKELLKETDTWKEVNADKNYKDLSEDERASETLSRIVAKDAAKKISEISDNKTLVAKLRAWLRQFWKDLKATFSKWSKDDLSKLKVDEFTKMPLRDLVEKVDLSKYTKAKNGQARMAQDRAELDAINAEREAIVSRAKIDGTYMKAPNGKPTNLTERQWADVRTSRFKEWFGDWEKAARVAKLRDSKPIAITGEEYKGKYELNRESAKDWAKTNLRKDYTIKDTGEVVSIGRKGVNKATSHSMGNVAHLKSFVAIPQMLENAIFISEEKAEKDNAQYPAYRYYAVGLNIGGVDYTAKLTIGIDENGKKYYDHALTEIEKGNLIEIANGFISTGAEPNPSVTGSKDTKLLSILQTNASKVVDENGEPMVVYHGTPSGGFNVFGNSKKQSLSYPVDGYMFASNRKVADGYSISGIYAKGEQMNGTPINPDNENIKIVKDVSGRYGAQIDGEWIADSYAETPEQAMNKAREVIGKKYYRTPQSEVKSVFVSLRNPLIIEAGQWKNMREYIAEAKRSGNDGVLIRNIEDSAIDIRSPHDESNSDVVAFSPNQIKSATDNVGTYDSRENDIRFMFAGEKGAVEADRVEEATTRMDNLAVARKMEVDFKERPARLEKLRNAKPVVITGNEIEPGEDIKQYRKNAEEYAKSLRGTYVNQDTGKEINVTRSGITELKQHDSDSVAHLQSFAAIPELIQQSTFITTLPNEDNKVKADSFDYFVAGLRIGGEDYTAKIVVANIDGKRYYDHKLTDIEKGNLIDLINKAPDSASNELSAKSGEISSDPIRIPNLNQEQGTIFVESGDVTNPIENPQSDAGKQITLSGIKDKRLLDILQTSDEENAKRIKLATGWERGADGKWRYEIPDAKIKGTITYNKSDGTTGSIKRWNLVENRNTTLGESVDAPELFDSYPQLKHVLLDTGYTTGMEKNNGYYDARQNLIVIHASDSEHLHSILNHEIQHVIQDIEGFASGGNPEMLEQQNRARIKELSERKSAIEREIANGTPESEYEDELADIDMELQDYNPDFGGYDHYRHLSGEVEARNVEKRMQMTPEERRASLAAETEDVAREDQIFLYDNLNATRSAYISEPAESNAPVEDNESQERTQVDALSAKIAALQAKARNRTQNVRELTAEVIRFVKDKANDEVLKNLGEQRFRSMMNGVQAAMMKIASDRITPERQRAEIRRQLDKIDTRVTEASVKSNRDAIEKMLNLRVYKFNPMGVLMGNRISENTRRIFDLVQAGITNKSKSWNERENRYVYYYTLNERQATTIDDLLQQIESQMYELPVEDNSVMHKIYAVQILQRYNNAITIHDAIDEINSNLNTAMAKRSAAFRAKQAALEAGDADEHAEQLLEWRRLGEEIVGLQGDLLNRTHLYNDALAEFRQGLESLIENGRSAWLDAVQQEAEERLALMRTAFSSIRVPGAIPYKEKEIGKDVAETKENRNNELRTLVSNALPAVATFDSMLRAICINDIGNRYGLYDKIMGGEDGLVFASDKQYKNKQMMFSVVEDKIKELGLGKDINALIARSKKPTDMKIFNKGVPAREKHNGKIMRDGDGNIIFQMIELNVGELMYLYSSSRQEQGRKMLLNAGIDELQIDTIADYIADEFPKEKQFVDWVTDELLPTQRYERYNGLYEYLYKTQMPDTPHYFPLEVNKKQLYKAEEIGEEVTTLPTSTVGSIIARREHNYGLNLDTNFVDKLIGHINDMEHWYAFAKPIKQINTLLSSTQFRNVVEAQAKGAVSLLKRVANIAVGGNEPNQAGKLPKLLRAISRNDIAANITFRFNTALKQTLSYPAYFAYSASPRYWMYMAKAFNPKNIKANWVWAMNELPTVRKRWESRSAGYDQFNVNDIKVKYLRAVRKAVSAGMWANSAVDLLTCTVGARAIYEFEYSNNLKSGMSPKEADTDAKYRAALFLNQTQQSGDGIFLSRMQKTPVFSQLMAYRNANTGYARLEIHAVAEATRMLSGKTRKRLIDARKEYYKGQGMSDTAAEHKAKHDYWQNFLRALMVIGVFGGVLPWAWQKGSKGILGYQPNKDDDDKDNGVFFIPGLSDMPIYGPAVDDIYRNSQTGFGLRNMKFISAPTLETIKNNGLILWDRWRNGEKADSYDKTALFVAFSLGARFGLAFDAKTFDNMLHGVAGIIRDKSLDYEDAMEMLNSPRSAVKAVVGPIRKGETKDEYMQRLSFANRRIRSNDVLDKKIEKLYFENLNNKLYKEMGISPSEVKALSERVKEVKKRLHLTGTGYVQEDYWDKYDNMPAAQSALVDSLGNRIYDIYYYDYDLNHAIEPDSTYKTNLKGKYEALKQLNEEYDKYIEQYGN